MRKHRTSEIGYFVVTSTILGFGMGGFIDGIVLHQILQWHQMISNNLPPDNLLNKEVNMFWDGIFHVATWTFTFIGIVMLYRSGRSGKKIASVPLFAGGLVLGWGIFNFLDSILNHYLFALHNVREQVAHPMMWNHYFLIFSIILIIIGLVLLNQGRKNTLAE